MIRGAEGKAPWGLPSASRNRAKSARLSVAHVTGRTRPAFHWSLLAPPQHPRHRTVHRQRPLRHHEPAPHRPDRCYPKYLRPLLHYCPRPLLFIFISAHPRTDSLRGSLCLNPHGFIRTGTQLRRDGQFTSQWPLAHDPLPRETSISSVGESSVVVSRSFVQT